MVNLHRVDRRPAGVRERGRTRHANARERRPRAVLACALALLAVTAGCGVAEREGVRVRTGGGERDRKPLFTVTEAAAFAHVTLPPAATGVRHDAAGGMDPAVWLSFRLPARQVERFLVTSGLPSRLRPGTAALQPGAGHRPGWRLDQPGRAYTSAENHVEDIVRQVVVERDPTGADPTAGIYLFAFHISSLPVLPPRTDALGKGWRQRGRATAADAAAFAHVTLPPSAADVQYEVAGSEDAVVWLRFRLPARQVERFLVTSGLPSRLRPGTAALQPGAGHRPGWRLDQPGRAYTSAENHVEDIVRQVVVERDPTGADPTAGIYLYAFTAPA